MNIDAHAHITGPLELYGHFRALSGATGPGPRPKLPEFSDEQMEESLKGHLVEVSDVGTDLQLVSPRPWAIPTGDRREPVVEHITQGVNNMIAQSVKLHPDRFAGIGAIPQLVTQSAIHCSTTLLC